MNLKQRYSRRFRLTPVKGSYWNKSALTYLKMLVVVVSQLYSGAVVATVQLKFVDANDNPVPEIVVSTLSQHRFSPETNPVVIDQVNREFKPHVSVIYAGQEVDFPNSDNIRHHVYSFAEKNTFEIKLYKNRPSKPVTFANPGIVTLGCNVHDDMLGFIYVSETNAEIVQTDNNGVVNLSTRGTIRYWHPRLSVSGTEVKTYEVAKQSDTQIVRVVLTPLPKKAPIKTFGSRKFGQ